MTFDVNVLVAAVGGGPHSFSAWPSPPPLSGNVAANCLGIVNDAREFNLCLSPHVITNLLRVLAFLGWTKENAVRYVQALREIVDRSDGEIVEPSVHVDDCRDFEDNRILELALASGSVLIVSNDSDLLEMSPWRGIPIVQPADFAGRVDAMRRSARRHGRRSR